MTLILQRQVQIPVLLLELEGVYIETVYVGIYIIKKKTVLHIEI